MAKLVIRLDIDRVSQKKTIVVSYESDADALPVEHEEEHRRLVGKLIEGGLIAAEDAGKVRVERAAAPSGKEEVGSSAEEAAKVAAEQKG